MKKLQFISGIAVIAFCLLAACKQGHKEHHPSGEQEIIPVKVSAASSIEIPGLINATGLVSTEEEAKYSFKIGGVITRIMVEEGQFFKKGQLLAMLNSTEISAGLEQAGYGLEKAQREYQRAENLYRDSVYTLEQLQNTRTALDIAKKSKEAVAFNERYSKIYAATNGFVSKKLAHEGEVIGEGMPVLLINATQPNNNYLLKIGVTDLEWASIKEGQKATVTLDGYTGKTFDATVFRKSQAADREIGSFQVELKLALGSTVPAVGMFGKAEIATSKNDSVMAISYESLVEADGNNGFVFVTVGDNKVKKVPVVITRFDNDKVYIKNELNRAERIVISNSAYLNEQSTIKIIR
ncbi:efflux RND transporter periplasmic adaptor subunit [Chitinophaga sp. RCC_12]|uniref:efflux RND transporter periplasmic adaptor subunit n=1 Tax=Chitinophaga sp. RCC_12 TaxID=3239226 RepID=UPI00352614A8